MGTATRRVSSTGVPIQGWEAKTAPSRRSATRMERNTRSPLGGWAISIRFAQPPRVDEGDGNEPEAPMSSCDQGREKEATR